MQKSGRQFQFVLSKDMAEANAKSKPVWQGFWWQGMGSSCVLRPRWQLHREWFGVQQKLMKVAMKGHIKAADLGQDWRRKVLSVQEKAKGFSTDET